ncbi:MAG: hypothetical protein ACLFPA_07190 [Dichotomicrobium sp.]
MTYTVRTHSFKRLILGLSPGSSAPATGLAVDLADLLQLDLLGLFLDDPSLRHLAGIPFAREFRPLGGGWRPLHGEQIAHEAELAARHAERAFTEAARRLATRFQFEVRRDPVAQAITALSQTTDIVMIAEPPSAAERATQQFFWLTEAAFHSPAAVLLVPTPMRRNAGPIVAIAARSDDRSIETAAAIAAAAGAPLVLLRAYAPDSGAAEPSALAAAELSVQTIDVAAAALSDPAICVTALARFGERLIVTSRHSEAWAFARALAAGRHAPVLVLEPDDAAGV